MSITLDPKALALADAYERVFRSEDGKVVLADLRARYHVGHTYLAKPEHLWGACEGQRSVVLDIQHQLDLARTADRSQKPAVTAESDVTAHQGDST